MAPLGSCLKCGVQMTRLRVSVTHGLSDVKVWGWNVERDGS